MQGLRQILGFYTRSHFKCAFPSQQQWLHPWVIFCICGSDFLLSHWNQQGRLGEILCQQYRKQQVKSGLSGGEQFKELVWSQEGESQEVWFRLEAGCLWSFYTHSWQAGLKVDSESPDQRSGQHSGYMCQTPRDTSLDSELPGSSCYGGAIDQHLVGCGPPLFQCKAQAEPYSCAGYSHAQGIGKMSGQCQRVICFCISAHQLQPNANPKNLLRAGDSNRKSWESFCTLRISSMFLMPVEGKT